MGIFLLIAGVFLMMGGFQVVLLFAALGFVIAVCVGGSMAVGKVLFRL
jgi:hypothetical protein